MRGAAGNGGPYRDSIRLGKLFETANAWRLPSLAARDKSKLSHSRLDADAKREPWMAFTPRRDTYSARREHPMPVDVIHALMGVVYLLTWACIGQMNVRRGTDAEIDANRNLP